MDNNNQKETATRIIASIFCPALVAIVVRIALGLIGLVLSWGAKIGLQIVTERTAENIATFNTFTWDESWGFWVIVIIVTFLIELAIWNVD